MPSKLPASIFREPLVFRAPPSASSQPDAKLTKELLQDAIACETCRRRGRVAGHVKAGHWFYLPSTSAVIHANVSAAADRGESQQCDDHRPQCMASILDQTIREHDASQTTIKRIVNDIQACKPSYMALFRAMVGKDRIVKKDVCRRIIRGQNPRSIYTLVVRRHRLHESMVADIQQPLMSPAVSRNAPSPPLWLQTNDEQSDNEEGEDDAHLSGYDGDGDTIDSDEETVFEDTDDYLMPMDTLDGFRDTDNGYDSDDFDGNDMEHVNNLINTEVIAYLISDELQSEMDEGYDDVMTPPDASSSDIADESDDDHTVFEDIGDECILPSVEEDDFDDFAVHGNLGNVSPLSFISLDDDDGAHGNGNDLEDDFERDMMAFCGCHDVPELWDSDPPPYLLELHQEYAGLRSRSQSPAQPQPDDQQDQEYHGTEGQSVPFGLGIIREFNQQVSSESEEENNNYAVGSGYTGGYCPPPATDESLPRTYLA